MEKYIESIDEINLGRRIGGGSCSEVFEMEPGIYFKRFCDDYADLDDPINIEFLETIRTISDIDYLPFVIRGKDIYRSSKELFGYSMDEVLALELEDLADDTLVSNLMLGFDGLKYSVRKLSDNHVKTEDIGGDNILFNGDMYLLDLDLSLVDKRFVPDELYEATRRNIFKSLFYAMTSVYFKGQVSDDDYFSYMNRIVDRCSEYANRELKTIGDVRSTYPKVYKKTTMS